LRVPELQLQALAFANLERRRTEEPDELLGRHADQAAARLLAWLLGIPIPILIIVYLLRGCT